MLEKAKKNSRQSLNALSGKKYVHLEKAQDLLMEYLKEHLQDTES